MQEVEGISCKEFLYLKHTNIKKQSVKGKILSHPTLGVLKTEDYKFELCETDEM